MSTAAKDVAERRRRARRGEGDLLRAEILGAARGLLAETGSETAVSILAEIIAARSGRPGGRLKESKGRIHERVAG